MRRQRKIGKLTGWLIIAIMALLWGRSLVAQVITPMELADPKMQRLQQRHLQALMAIGRELEEHKFAYPYYFSRVLDVDMAKMQLADQRSIRFDTYNSETVLEITGNYYAAYSADRMDPPTRLKETFRQVVMPILAAEVPHFADDSEFSAFAIEVSHHVRQKVMGVTSENPENVTVVMPVAAAQKLVDAKTDEQRQVAILDGEVFLNGQPYSMWLQEGVPSEDWKERTSAAMAAKKHPQMAGIAESKVAPTGSTTVSASLVNASATTMRIFTPESLALLQGQNQDAIDRMVKSLDKEAHFFPYAPPVFIGFRHGAYLQLSFQTRLQVAAGSSRYKLTALAFDEHVAHLIRPILDYFPADANFDGIDFSSVIELPDGSKSEAAEYFLPLRMMRCFAKLDCTGQQLLDAGTVLINGERSALDLQVAEGKN